MEAAIANSSSEHEPADVRTPKEGNDNRLADSSRSSAAAIMNNLAQALLRKRVEDEENIPNPLQVS